MFIDEFLTENKDLFALILAIYAAALSTLNFTSPRIKEWLEQRNAIFKALQGDRKAIASISLSVIDGDFEQRLKSDSGFRARLLRSLAMAAGLESSDRGKAYVLAALCHIAKMDAAFRTEAGEQIGRVEKTFLQYVASGADAKFKSERLIPLQAIKSAIAGGDRVVPQMPPN